MRSFRCAKGARDVLIVGGGDGGRLVVRELIRNPQLRLRPVGFVDDDPRKLGIKDEHGLKVLGTTSSEDLARVLDEVEPDEVVIAIPSAPGTLRARVVTACRERGIPVRTTADGVRAAAGQLRPSAASPASCARSASRTCSAASRCGWSSSASAPTWPARS